MQEARKPELLPELRLRILSLLPHNDLALGGRLCCKEAAQQFSQLQHRTADFSHPVPAHGLTPLLQQCTLGQKLALLLASPKSGVEANVEVMWQMLEPQLFPELLRTEHYCAFLPRPEADMGSVVVASGLAHLLPSLQQRCSGLLDPGRTLEAAARHCDLAGLQAAWELLGQRLKSSLEQPGFWTLRDVTPHGVAATVWARIMAAAVGSTTSDALAKMEWLADIDPCNGAWARLACVGGAAAASGDMGRVRWLAERGFEWGTGEVLRAVMRHADLAFIQRLEQEGLLPPAADVEAWSDTAARGAAVAASGGAAKLRWLAERGGWNTEQVLIEAAGQGELERLQYLAEPWRVGEHLRLPQDVLEVAVGSGSIPTAAWLRQEGCRLSSDLFGSALRRGHLHMVRWLLEAGCPRGSLDLCDAVTWWPSRTPGDSGRLVEAVQLLAAAGWPVVSERVPRGAWRASLRVSNPLEAAAQAGHPWPVWQALLDLLPPGARHVPFDAALHAASTGCEAALEALVRLGVCDKYRPGLARAWYAAAAKNGDLGTLSCLVRLGVPLGEGVLAAAVEEGAPLCALQWLVGQGAVVGVQEQQVLARWDAYCKAPREHERQGVEAWLWGLLE